MSSTIAQMPKGIPKKQQEVNIGIMATIAPGVMMIPRPFMRSMFIPAHSING